MPIKYDDKFLIRPGINKEYTAEQLKEVLRCSQDIIYFAEHYYTIVHAVEGEQLIKLMPFQKRMLQAFQKNRFNIVLSARQIGKTTCTCIYLLWFAIFQVEQKTIGILANKQRTAKSIVDDIKKAYEKLPPWIKPGIKAYNDLNITFENDTRIFASATTEDALRGETMSLLFCDEFAFVPQNIAEPFWRSNFPTLSTGGNAILVSTPNGAAGKFFEIYKEAETGKSPFVPFRVNWNELPSRDEKWKEETIAAIGKVAFAQEYGCSFTGSSSTLIDGDILTKLIGEEPPFNPTPYYSIWKKYVPGRVYAFGVDTAHGGGNDYSVINIYDITTYPYDGKYEQVALYRRNDANIFEFEKECLELTAKWGNPILICETNETGLGNVFCESIYMEDGYERVFYDMDEGKYGIYSNVKTKKLMTTYIKDDIEKGKMKINSKIMISELGIFEEKESSPGTFAARKGRGFNDDTVMSGGWVSYMLRSRWFGDMVDELYTNPKTNLMIEENDNEKIDAERLDIFNNIFQTDHDNNDNFERELWN